MSDQGMPIGSQFAPYSEEAEAAVIGAVLINPDSFVTVSAFLTAEDFYLIKHGYIWEAMRRISERREGIDQLTVSKELHDMNRLNDIGGPSYLVYLIDGTPNSVHAEYYGRLVERASTRRRLLVASDEIKALAVNEEMDMQAVIANAEARLFNVTDRQIKREFVTMPDAVNEYFDRIENLMQNPDQPLGTPSGFRDLDKLLGGLQRSDLLIFAGRPGMGKTSWMLSAAMNAARIGARIAIFSMEMGADQIVQRLMAMETGINTQRLRLGQLTQQEYSRFVEVAGRISSFPIFIDDTPAINPMQMRTKCRRLQHEHGLDLVIVDYMQLMNAGGTYQNNRVQEISYISRSLKELARELNVPLLSAAQLSRAVEQRQDKRPVLSDLRESGCITGDSLVYLPDEGRAVPIADLMGKTGFRVLSLNTDTYKLEPGIVTNAFPTGTKPIYKLTTRLGRTIRATANHKFLTICGWKRLDELTAQDHVALPRHTVITDDAGVVPTEVVRRVEAGSAKSALNHTSSGYSPSPHEGEGQTNRRFVGVRAIGDIYWDAITSIEYDGDQPVYDLTVEAHHNFMANNIVVHNSIEQDADIVMFLYRDVVYNEATEFPNQAEVIVAKHRNGPTGAINLYFDGSLTKFLDAVSRSVDLGSY